MYFDTSRQVGLGLGVCDAKACKSTGFERYWVRNFTAWKDGSWFFAKIGEQMVIRWNDIAMN